MADLEHMLLAAAGRTGTSGRKNLSRSKLRRRHDGSDSDDDSDMRDYDSDDQGFTSRKALGPQVPLKKRFDPPEKDDRSDQEDDEWDDDDERNSYSDSELSVGSDLYIDDEDREKLSKLSELEREMILTERGEKRDDYWLKKKAREATMNDRKAGKGAPPSRICRSSVKSDKMTAKDDALNGLREKRKRQQDADYFPRSTSTTVVSEGAGSPRETSPAQQKALPVTASPSDTSGSGDRKYRREEGSAGDNELVDSDEDDSMYGMDQLTFADIKEITIRRSLLAKWFKEPFFDELMEGCFVRVGIGMTKTGENLYRLCMVKNVDATDPTRQYKFENKTTYKYLNCIWGSDASAARWQMARVSDSPPLEEEFSALVHEVERRGGLMPRQKAVLVKIEAIQEANNFVYSAATVKQMLQEKKSASSKPLNMAAEKDRLRKEMEVAESRGDETEMERIRIRLKELAEISRQVGYKDVKAMKLAEMNRKNRAENFKNASELKPLNIGLKAGEAGYDPFTRRWTRSRNYYLSEPGGEEEAATENGHSVQVSANSKVEAGEAATAAALEAAAGAGKLVDTKAPVDLGTQSNMLHNFDLPISLSLLQKFGGAQGVYAGFMARRQKIEAAMGCRVPENDGEQHTLTLTVSDYKRRRGLL